MEYKAIGKAMRHYTDSGEDVMTDPLPIDLHAAKLELVARARALGFRQARRHQHRNPRGRATSVALARSRLPRRDGLHAAAWNPAQPAGGAGAGHGPGDQRTHGLLAAAAARSPRRSAGRAGPWAMSRGTRWGATTTRSCVGRLAHSSRRSCRPHRPFRLPRLCRQRARAGESPGARRRLGWIGKHTNLLARDAGSWFFLGEILTDLPLPLDTPASAHCGTCQACIPACPTRRDRRALSAGCAPLHLLSDHRASQRDSGRVAPGAG